MATEKQIAVSGLKKLVDTPYYQQQFKNALGANAGTFATSIMEVVTSDDKLLSCSAASLMQEAVKAASLKLPINKQLGYAYLVPFNNKDKVTGQYKMTPTLVIGYKGYLQLAIRSGQYREINAGIVYEGEMIGQNKLTGLIDLTGNRISDKIEGYFAYFELLNGFRKTLYMPLDEMIKYALRFSPTLRGKYAPSEDALKDIAQSQASNGSGNGVGWQADFNAMAQKTVLRRLLGKYGYLSIEMQTAYAQEVQAESAARETRDEANNATMQERDIRDADAEEVTTTRVAPEHVQPQSDTRTEHEASPI